MIKKIVSIVLSIGILTGGNYEAFPFAFVQRTATVRVSPAESRALAAEPVFVGPAASRTEVGPSVICSRPMPRFRTSGARAALRLLGLAFVFSPLAMVHAAWNVVSLTVTDMVVAVNEPGLQQRPESFWAGVISEDEMVKQRYADQLRLFLERENIRPHVKWAVFFQKNAPSFPGVTAKARFGTEPIADAYGTFEGLAFIVSESAMKDPLFDEQYIYTACHEGYHLLTYVESAEKSDAILREIASKLGLSPSDATVAKSLVWAAVKAEYEFQAISFGLDHLRRNGFKEPGRKLKASIAAEQSVHGDRFNTTLGQMTPAVRDAFLDAFRREFPNSTLERSFPPQKKTNAVHGSRTLRDAA